MFISDFFICFSFRDPEVENSGRYTCSVVNDVGAAMSMSHVLVYEERDFATNMSTDHLNIYKVGYI